MFWPIFFVEKSTEQAPIIAVDKIEIGKNWEKKWKQRDTLSEATVTLRTVVTFVTWLISRTEFLVEKVFYNANFLQN